MTRTRYRRVRRSRTSSGKPSEHQIQAAFINWCRLKAMQDSRYDHVMAVPNAGRRSFALAARMKREGMSAGFPDTFLFVPNDCYAGLAIEFKVPGNTTTDNQDLWLMRLSRAGYLALVAWSTEQAISFTEAYMVTAKPLATYPEVSSGACVTHRKPRAIRQRKSRQLPQ